VLDSIGLASRARHRNAVTSRKYLEHWHRLGRGQHGNRSPARACALRFASRLMIHADDYDDTQLAVAGSRLQLLTHPTAPALPPALALAEHKSAQRCRPHAPIKSVWVSTR
jgi:2-methylcitrate dehydratase PrpD